MNYVLRLLLVMAGLLIGTFFQYHRDMRACKQYYKVLPEREKPGVCKEVLGR